MAARRWRTGGGGRRKRNGSAAYRVPGSGTSRASRLPDALREDACTSIFAKPSAAVARRRATSQLLAMSASARVGFAFAVSAVMLALGVLVAVRPLWSGGRPLTQSWWLDGAFALFFLVRGAYGVRLARRQAQLSARAE